MVAVTADVIISFHTVNDTRNVITVFKRMPVVLIPIETYSVHLPLKYILKINCNIISHLYLDFPSLSLP